MNKLIISLENFLASIRGVFTKDVDTIVSVVHTMNTKLDALIERETEIVSNLRMTVVTKEAEIAKATTIVGKLRALVS